jgi:hypothetical protein
MRKLLTGAALALWVSAVAYAQTPQKKPTPSPEQKKLGYFVGTWIQEGDMKASPYGPAGKITSTETCEWFTGGFHVVCRSTGEGPMGTLKGLGFMAYGAEDKAYAYHGIDNMGMNVSAKGTYDGKTWTFASDEKMGGKLIHSRYVMAETSPTAYTGKWEMSEDGQHWTTAMEMKSTKAEAKK